MGCPFCYGWITNHEKRSRLDIFQAEIVVRHRFDA